MKLSIFAATVLTLSLPANLAAHPVRLAQERGCIALSRGFWLDVFAGRNAEATRKYITPAYIQHSPPPQPRGEDWIAVWRGVFHVPPYGPGKDFPEAQKNFKTEITAIKGDDHFAILSVHDTAAFDHGPETGKPYDLRYSDIFRCAHGHVVEHWFSPEP